jgi:hypothetical protein
MVNGLIFFNTRRPEHACENISNESFVKNLVHNLFISLLDDLLSTDGNVRSVMNDKVAILLAVDPLNINIKLNYS